MKTPDEIKKALECHKDGSACNDCPYKHGRTFSMERVAFSCSRDIITDALAYIEQLESRVEPKNRVLTLEEVEAYCEGGADATPLWYEEKDRNVNRWMIIDLPELAFGSTATVKRLVNSQFFEATYGEKGRCGLRKPTAEEMEETLWEGDSHE